ncbi:MAG: flippase-like domain-containing protein, partial [Chloroflexota bacterium]|nr:flippase-like domain-containing protein [Chloroflexota bacterium]
MIADRSPDPSPNPSPEGRGELHILNSELRTQNSELPSGGGGESRTPNSTLNTQHSTLPQGGRRAWLLRGAGLVLLLALIGYLVWRGQLRPADIARVLGQANPTLVALSVGFYFPFVLIKSERWRVLARGLGVVMGMGEAWRLYAIGLGAGAFTPGQAGDLVKAWALQARGHRLGAAIASSVLDRLFDLAGLAPLAALGLAVFGADFGGGVGAVVLLSLAAVAAVIVVARRDVLLRMVGRRSSGVRGQGSGVGGRGSDAEPNPQSLTATQHSTLNTQHSVVPSPTQHSTLNTQHLIVATAWTVASFAVSTVRVWLLAEAIGLRLDAAQVGGLVGLTTVAALVPVSVSGVGTRDAAMVALLGRLVPDPATAAAQAVA